MATQNATIDVKFELDQAAVIKPGETLILRYTKPVSTEVGEGLKAKVKGLIPGIEVVVIGACDQMLVYDPIRESDQGLVVRPEDTVVIQTTPDAEPIVVHGRDIAVVRPEETS